MMVYFLVMNSKRTKPNRNPNPKRSAVFLRPLNCNLAKLLPNLRLQVRPLSMQI